MEGVEGVEGVGILEQCRGGRSFVPGSHNLTGQWASASSPHVDGAGKRQL